MAFCATGFGDVELERKRRSAIAQREWAKNEGPGEYVEEGRGEPGIYAKKKKV